MKDSKPNEYGLFPKFEIGDTVRVWPIFKNPTGTIERIADAESFPIKFVVRYTYHTGDVYVETFASDDLTLVERSSRYYCNCKTGSERHATWCNWYNNPRRW